jgi:hypothetical protein
MIRSKTEHVPESPDSRPREVDHEPLHNRGYPPRCSLIVARDRISVSHFIDVAYLGRLSLHSVSKSESSDDHQKRTSTVNVTVRASGLDPI